VWKLNIRLTGADIDPTAELAAGLLIPYPAGVSITGTAGRNLTVMPLACIVCDTVTENGAKQLWPKLGSDVVLGHHAVICGTVTVADGVRIEAGVTVTSDVPEGSVMEGPRTKIFVAKRVPGS
jgi:serine acetyltransferase